MNSLIGLVQEEGPGLRCDLEYTVAGCGECALEGL